MILREVALALSILMGAENAPGKYPEVRRDNLVEVTRPVTEDYLTQDERVFFQGIFCEDKANAIALAEFYNQNEKKEIEVRCQRMILPIKVLGLEERVGEINVIKVEVHEEEYYLVTKKGYKSRGIEIKFEEENFETGTSLSDA